MDNHLDSTPATKGIIYKIYLGLNDKETKTQLIQRAEATSIIADILTPIGLFYTLYETNGSYEYEDKTRVNEQGFVIEFVITNKQDNELLSDNIESIINKLKIQLNQESVLVTGSYLELCSFM